MLKVSRTRTKAISQTVLCTTRNAARSTTGGQTKNQPELQLLNLVKKKYSENRNKTNAAAMKQYMRGQFEFFGLKSPERRAIDKEVLAQIPTISDVSTIRKQLVLLWQREEREFQLFGIDYATKNLKILIGPDLLTCTDSLECMKNLIETKSWWDTVDMLASKIVGGLVSAHPEELGKEMDRWIVDEDMWVRRTAILHQLNYNNNTDQDKLFRYCLLCCHEKEFFIQKAIGWALRNYFRYNPTSVKSFVKKNEDKLAKLSVKEALKHA